MNILFLNVGRRCELVESFRQALLRRGGGKIYGSDISPLAPGLQVVDYPAIFPAGDSPGFLDHLSEFCCTYDIHLVIPTIDPDLIRLDQIRDEFQKRCPNTRLLLSSSYSIDQARNKNLTKERMRALGVNVPKSISRSEDNDSYPIFVRPADGSSGVGAMKVDSKLDLQWALAKYSNLMLEEFIPGEEYTVDVLCNFSGKALIAIPRKRIKVRAGEVVQGIIERNPQLEALAMHIAEGFMALGPVTVQFRCPVSNTVVGIELNARMGGGLPLSIAAGADWAGWILDLCNGQEPDLSVAITDKLIITRCDRSFYMTNAEVQNIDFAKRQQVPVDAISLYRDIQAWVFDMDDTLYPERSFVFNGYRCVAEQIMKDYNIEVEQELQELFLSGARGDLFTAVFRRRGINVDEDYVKRLVKLYRFNSGILKPYVDVIPLLSKLKAYGKSIGLVSDGWQAVQREKFNKLSLQSYFDAVVFTDALGGSKAWKPSEAGYKVCLSLLGVDPKQALYIGDNDRKDFIGAKNLGMKTLKICRKGSVHHPFSCSDDVLKADIQLDSFTELL